MGFLQSASEPTLVFVQIWQNAIQKITRNSGLIIFQNVLLYCIEQKVSKDNSELLSLEQVNTETVGGSNTVQCADITWDVCMGTGQQHHLYDGSIPSRKMWKLISGVLLTISQNQFEMVVQMYCAAKRDTSSDRRTARHQFQNKKKPLWNHFEPPRPQRSKWRKFLHQTAALELEGVMSPQRSPAKSNLAGHSLKCEAQFLEVVLSDFWVTQIRYKFYPFQ